MPRKETDNQIVYNFRVDLDHLNRFLEPCLRSGSGKATPQQMETTVDLLQSLKKHYDSGKLDEKSEKSYEKLLDTLKAPKEETELHKAIKKRALDSLAKCAGNMTEEAISDALFYNELYEDVSNSKRINAECEKNEKKYHIERETAVCLQFALKDHDQRELQDQMIRRDRDGLTAERNQLINENFEQGKLFQSCSIALQSLSEYSEKEAKKEAKTLEDVVMHNHTKDLRHAFLFAPYMDVVKVMTEVKDRNIYSKETLQTALEQFGEEKDTKNIADFEECIEEHNNRIMQKFEEYDALQERIYELNKGKKPKTFDNMLDQMEIFGRNKWNNGQYKENCLYGAWMDQYNSQLEQMLGKVDAYIRRKESQFFPGKIGRQRLEAARDMHRVLTAMREQMKEFRKYASAERQQEVQYKRMMRKQKAQEQKVQEQKVQVQKVQVQKVQDQNAPEKKAQDPAAFSLRRSNSFSERPLSAKRDKNAGRARRNSVSRKSPAIQNAVVKKSAKKPVKKLAKKLAEKSANKTAAVKKAKGNNAERKLQTVRKPSGKTGTVKKTAAKKTAAQKTTVKKTTENKTTVKAAVAGKTSGQKAREQVSIAQLRQELAGTDVKRRFKELEEGRSTLKRPRMEKLEKLDIRALARNMKETKETADKRYRPKEAEDHQMNRKLRLDPPTMKR